MKTRGFTLMELLVVLAIIGTLAGIAIPMTRSVVGKSRQAACLDKLRGLGVGLQGYLQDNNNRMPTLASSRTFKTEDVAAMDTILLPYLGGSLEAFHCPADQEAFAKSGSSYCWNPFIKGGEPISRSAAFGIDAERLPLIYDKEAWHPVGTNFLYPDMSSSNQLRFAVGN